jgi:O-antigen/teichoic acid export membrane protein
LKHERGIAIERLLRLLPRGRFVRRIAWLSGGTLLGQLILLAAMPLLTRLFTPEEFGLFGVLSAINGIFGLVMAGRYEFAIPLAAKDDEAAAVVVLAGLITLFLTLLSLILVWTLGDALAQLTGLPALVPLLWLVPLILLATGLGQPFEYWSIRRGTLRLNGLSRVVTSGAQAGSQAALGVAGAGAFGLTLGYGLGYLARVMLFLVTLPAADRAAMAAARLPQIRQLAWTLRFYPTYSTGSSLLKSTTQFLPTILLAALYGPAVAGAFNLAQRILTVPVRLLGMSTSQAFLAEAAQRSAAGVMRLFVRTVPRFLAVGFIGMAPLLLAGPALFALIFGEPWRDAGGFAQALVAVQLARFVAMPVSQSFNVFGRQDLEFHTSLLNGLALVVSFCLITWLKPPAYTAVLLYSLATAMSYVVMLSLAWRTTRHAATSAATAAPNDRDQSQ